jgi:hypothetical protein
MEELLGSLKENFHDSLYDDRMENAKKTFFTKMMRKLRNIIAHGDYKGIQQLFKRYRNEFIINYQYANSNIV